MSDNSPYDPTQAPTDSVVGADHRRWQLMEPQACSAGRGMGWISDGFRLFLAAPGIWIVNFIIFAVISLVLGVIPLVSFLGNVLAPIFTAGLLFGARQLDEHGPLKVDHLFAGFSENGGKLAGLGALTIVMAIGVAALVVIVFLMFVGTTALTEPAADPAQWGTSVVIMALLVLSLTVPILMAYWFAPALIAFHGMGVFDALKLSFLGCLRNMLPFLVYGLVMSLAMVVAVIPMLAGLLVLVPVIFGSMYASYREIFTDPPEDTLLSG